MTAADRKRLDRLINKASSVLGCSLDTVEVVRERRMTRRLYSMLSNDSHPMYGTVTALRSSIRDRLLHPKCLRERYRRSFLPAVAIQNPSLQEREWNSVARWSSSLRRFYSFSLKVEESLPESLTCPPLTPTQHLERKQALGKQFAEILHFTLRFDELEVCGNTRVKLIHTLSLFYFITIHLWFLHPQLDIESEVNNEMANRMSLFYTEATPMLKTLSNATTNFVTENKILPLENTTGCLSTMASVCKVMLETP
ncbi:protein FAM49A-like [Archocentrus centrarchus]|uniref:protein FAM49A-like n=1 Tax=Archocentrus centrarchus TaxID=63155 RepID=UPI0011E9C014|nr:protein FAM49A-like [Archocentrus centrarchus]